MSYIAYRLLPVIVAIGSVATALLLTYLLWPWIEPHPTSIFLGAVTVTAWYGGLRAGLFATALAILVEDFFFIAPTHSFEMTADNTVRICAFVVVALLISWIDSARKKAIAERDQMIFLEQESRKKAEAANRTKDEFLAMVSHELKTPLNVILGWTSMIQTGKLNDEAVADAIDRIERNAARQQKLVEDLIDVSRIAAGKLHIEAQLVDLHRVIEAGISVVALAATAKNIDIRVFDSDETINVVGDPDRLQQVLWNLLTNSIKFTPERGYIELRLTRAGHYARLTLRDSGHGIEADLLPRIFEPFRQGEKGGNETKGVGLGLSIVQHIVELHGGVVHAESAGKDQGTTFILNLPLASAETPRTIEVRSAVTDVTTPTNLVMSARTR